MIVGTDLKQIERVTGRLTRGRVAGAGALSGMWLGLFVGLIFSLFDANRGALTIVSTVVFGAVFGLVWALIGYAATRGQRDFTSVSQVVATRYEVLVEHKFAEQARELLAQMPGGGSGPAARLSAAAPAAAAHRRPAGSLPAAGADACPAGAGHPSGGTTRFHSPAIHASTSVEVRGMPAERFSQPSAVTSTSSSIRTPMPRSSLRDEQVVGLEVQAGLDGEDHARREHGVHVLLAGREGAVVDVDARGGGWCRAPSSGGGTARAPCPASPRRRRPRAAGPTRAGARR